MPNKETNAKRREEERSNRTFVNIMDRISRKFIGQVKDTDTPLFTYKNAIQLGRNNINNQGVCSRTYDNCPMDPYDLIQMFSQQHTECISHDL